MNGVLEIIHKSGVHYNFLIRNIVATMVHNGKMLTLHCVGSKGVEFHFSDIRYMGHIGGNTVTGRVVRAFKEFKEEGGE